MILSDTMRLFQAIILGLVQGIVEFLPISSAAHMRTVPALLGWPYPVIPYPLVIQVGAAAAGLVCFGIYLLRPAAGTASRPSRARLAWYVGMATVPLAVLAALFKKSIDVNLQSPWVMSSALIVLAVVMFAVERGAAKRRALDDVGFKDALCRSRPRARPTRVLKKVLR